MNRLEELRKSKGKNMAQVSRELNIPYTTYVGYEKGDREPNSEALILFATYYNVTVDYIIGRDGEIKEEYLLAARTPDGKQAIRKLTKQQYEIAKSVIESLEQNTDDDL